MKKIIMLLMGLSMVAFGKEPAKIKVGITQIIEHQALDSAREGFIKALKDGGYTRYSSGVDDNPKSYRTCSFK